MTLAAQALARNAPSRPASRRLPLDAQPRDLTAPAPRQPTYLPVFFLLLNTGADVFFADSFSALRPVSRY
ncbi:MAG: hypothetical protein EA370_16390 [Wenzhouxiangella sp.]|nr:MAG: hypothetical protein EA370_16390 [Wenzhouxiangella sp.]